MQVRTYARWTGVLLVLSIIAGGFGEAYVPSKMMVANNAVATAANVTLHATLFRLGFAAYLVEAICDIALSLLFYVLLAPVQRHVALLGAFFGLVSTSVFAVAEGFYAFTPVVLKYATPNLALLSMKAYGFGGTAFLAFYGIAMLIRGVLIYRSRYLPKFLGVLLVIAGLGFIARNAMYIFAPQVHSDVLLLPTFIAIVALAVWMLTKGIDVTAWETSLS